MRYDNMVRPSKLQWWATRDLLERSRVAAEQKQHSASCSHLRDFAKKQYTTHILLPTVVFPVFRSTYADCFTGPRN